tara:strand:- start:3239 stop:4072 length:834 start_codon:yes stop_codon:yes gene_type:complete
MQLDELTVVIVTFKSEKKITQCLDSISPQVKILIIENSDNKNFKSYLEKKYKNLSCILVGSNKGYSTANNIGLKLVKTKFALVLNPDAILDENAIKNFFLSAKKNEDFWLIGPLDNQDQKINSNNENILEVKNLKGFAIFFHVAKFERKFFDENFFLYFEEIDLCKRVKKQNGKIYLDSSIKIKHEGASSVNKENKLEIEKNRNWHWMWSTFYFHKKHKGYLIAFIIILPKLLSALAKTIFYLIIFKKELKEIYSCRLSGILNSLIGNKSWYRPSLD